MGGAVAGELQQRYHRDLDQQKQVVTLKASLR
jgi:hypothetical protein